MIKQAVATKVWSQAEVIIPHFMQVEVKHYCNQNQGSMIILWMVIIDGLHLSILHPVSKKCPKYYPMHHISFNQQCTTTERSFLDSFMLDIILFTVDFSPLLFHINIIKLIFISLKFLLNDNKPALLSYNVAIFVDVFLL